MCHYTGSPMCFRNIEFISKESLGHFKTFLDEENRYEQIFIEHWLCCVPVTVLGPGETGLNDSVPVFCFVLFCFASNSPCMVKT